MNQKEKFMINQGLMILGFAYALSDYDMASCVFGIFAAGMAVYPHSAGTLKKGMIIIPAAALMQVILVNVMHMGEMLPSLGFLTVCNTVCVYLWMQSSYKAIDDVVRMMTAGFLICLIIILGLPAGVIEFFAGAVYATRLQELVFTALIFMPCIISYALKCWIDYGIPVHEPQKRKTLEQQVRLR